MYAASIRREMPEPGRNRQRTVAFLLALIVHILVVIFFLLLKSDPVPPKEIDEPNTFVLAPDSGDKAKQNKPRKTKKSATAQAAPHRPMPETPAPRTSSKSPLFIPISPEDFAASDISKFPSKPAGSPSNGSGESASVAGPGEGPGGVRLYEAEWYRHPTNAELATYMPTNAPPNGWGLVACKTVEHYRVENCQALGESPLGSGLARAVREAAWQFRVLPPRIDGKPVVGAWVRIRINYSERARG
jgi:protein TonB